MTQFQAPFVIHNDIQKKTLSWKTKGKLDILRSFDNALSKYLFCIKSLECIAYISGYLPKLDRGLGLVSDAYNLHYHSMKNLLM